MKIIINIESKEAEKYVYRDIAKIIENTQETGQCGLIYSDEDETHIFVNKTKTGYKIHAYCKN